MARVVRVQRRGQPATPSPAARRVRTRAECEVAPLFELTSADGGAPREPRPADAASRPVVCEDNIRPWRRDLEFGRSTSFTQHLCAHNTRPDAPCLVGEAEPDAAPLALRAPRIQRPRPSGRRQSGASAVPLRDVLPRTYDAVNELLFALSERHPLSIRCGLAAHFSPPSSLLATLPSPRLAS